MRLRPTGWWLLLTEDTNGQETLLDHYQTFDLAWDAADELVHEMKQGRRPDLARVRVCREFKPPAHEAPPL